MAIYNDSEFKAQLSRLPVAQQRAVAAIFTENVLSLCTDARVKRAVEAAKHPDTSEKELTSAFQEARQASVESYTQCGQDADWLRQAGHFVAKAAMACVMPAGPGATLAWEAAMNARMARNSETIAIGDGTGNHEAELQFHLLAEYLDQ